MAANDLKEDPKDLAPGLIGQMLAWIRANCLDYSKSTDLWFCQECGLESVLKEDVLHEPECEIQAMTELANTVTTCRHEPHPWKTCPWCEHDKT